ncbi:uncharacterized protein LOC115018213 [Cottoperca gobio]|uniref:Uncharacterized protein LOC115018213 n=1 Tax=Cottoperca gobio TaxID=56716 RepID=A0A6J2R0L3_COTGO|nr:uncharacterized protein LOC115018213 [Cottoperca gobio]
MDKIISLFVLSTLPQLVVPQATHVTSFRAVMEMVSGDSRIFSGESVRLKCSIPDVHRSSWNYLWFRGSEQLLQIGDHLILWKAKVQESGTFYCQGVRDTLVGNIHTRQSLPLEINVDGGYAILHVSPHPALVGDTLNVTCRVRGPPELHEMILYKDGVEVMKQNGLNPHFYLTNLTLDDQGTYSCRASWHAHRRTHSVISADAPVHVLEVLSQPVLEIVDDNLIPFNRMKLICHLQYNAHAPIPPIHYYFYMNNNRLGQATSENHDLVKRTPGQYSCKARVPELGISRYSEPENFGQATGPETMTPPVLHPRDPRPLAPPSISSPDLSLPPAAEPTAARPSPHRSTATPAFIQPTEVSIQSSNPLLKPSLPATSTLLSTVQSVNQTATDFNIFEESGDMSGESGDMSEESGDMSGESGDMS